MLGDLTSKDRLEQRKFINIQGKVTDDKGLVPRYSDVDIIGALDYAKKAGLVVFTSNIPNCLLGKHMHTSMEIHTRMTQSKSYFLNKIDVLDFDLDRQLNHDIKPRRVLNRNCEKCESNMFCSYLPDRYVELYGDKEIEPIKFDIDKVIEKMDGFVQLEQIK